MAPKGGKLRQTADREIGCLPLTFARLSVGRATGCQFESSVRLNRTLELTTLITKIPRTMTV